MGDTLTSYTIHAGTFRPTTRNPAPKLPLSCVVHSLRAVHRFVSAAVGDAWGEWILWGSHAFAPLAWANPETGEVILARVRELPALPRLPARGPLCR